MNDLVSRLDNQPLERRRALARLLAQREAKTTTTWAIPRRPATGALPLSFAQQRLWFLGQLNPNNLAFNIHSSARLDGPLDIAALQRALDELVRRHEVLRTTFPAVDGVPVQIIHPPAPLPLPIEDLRVIAEPDRQAEAGRLVLEEVERQFDLARGPLLRVTLLRLADTAHILLVTMHHIISDGWSANIFTCELAALYNALLNGHAASLPELAIQYADFASWQQTMPQPDLLRAMDYWKRQLAHAPAVSALPTDRPRPALQTFRGARHPFIYPALAEGFKTLNRQEGTTLFMTLLAAFQTLLYRYTGQEDLVVGTPIANRHHIEVERLIGLFVNMLAIRSDLSGDPSFRALLRRVRETALEAYAHQDLPFEKLVEELAPERDLSRTPLFQLVFAFHSTRAAELPDFAGLAMSPVEVVSTASNFDITLHLWEEGSAIGGVIEYNTDLFEGATIARLVGHLQMLLEGIVSAPDLPISRLPLITGAERHALLAHNQAAQAEHGSLVCLHRQFEAQAARRPNADAVVYEDRRLTYRELNQRANQLAHHLRSLGVGPDVLVALYVERSPELVVAILGILKAGGAYLPIDPLYPKDRVAYMLEDSRAPVLLTQESLRANLPALATHVIALDGDWGMIAQAPTHNSALPATVDQLAYVIYTSGSTGRPKGALISHANVARLFEMTQSRYDFSHADVWTFFHSQAFDFSVWELWGALLYGGRLVVVPYMISRSPGDFCELLAREHVTILNQTPSAFRQLMHAEQARATQLPDLRLVIFGGEALDIPSLRPWFERYGDQKPLLVNMYGITETTVHVTHRALTIEDARPGGASVIGPPIADLQLFILDRQLQPVPIGIPGELYVGGAGLARGYLGRPDLTAQRFIPNPFATTTDDRRPTTDRAENRRWKIEDGSLDTSEKRSSILHPPSSGGVGGQWSAVGGRLYRTGDLARHLPNGDIEYLGRIDHQVKIRGFRIELGEIETVLGQHPAVRECTVLVQDDPSGDKRLVAYLIPTTDDRRPTTDPDDKVTRRPGDKVTESAEEVTLSPLHRVTVSGPAVVGELRAFLQERLPSYMVPAAFVFLDAFPLTANGKLDRAALPEPALDRAELAGAGIAPRDTLELQMAQVWEEVLNVRPIGVTDNFFELGGHSLLAVRLMARIEQAFGRDLPLSALFQGPTVEQLTATLRQGSDSAAWSPLVPIQPNGDRPPFFCVHPVGGNVLCYVDLARSIGPDQPFYGLQSPGLVRRQQPFEQIEEMAASYVAAIRELQPTGPYSLGGWCFGGVVALEIARQLECQGQVVALVALIDTFAPIPRAEQINIDYATLVSWFTRDMAVHYGKALIVAPEELRPLEPEAQLHHVLERMQAAQIMPPDTNVDQLRRYLHVYTTNAQAMGRYTPPNGMGPITLLRASERDPGTDPTLGWDRYGARLVAIHDVPGNHNTMVFAPHVARLAEQLRAGIDEARAALDATAAIYQGAFA